MGGKIKDIRIDVVRRELPAAGGTDAGVRAGQIEQGVLRVVTDDGIEGNCFVGAHWGRAEPSFKPILEVIKPELAGRDAADREWLWSRHKYFCTRGKLTTQAWAPVDIALWDIAGKAAQQPIFKLLGARRHEAMAYASFPTRFDTPEGFVTEAEEVLENGFSAYKIHPGPLAADDVAEMVALVRRRVGDGYHLMLDPDCGYNFATALRVGGALDEQDFHWYEDPLPHHEVDGLRELSRRLRTPLSIGDQAPFQLFDSAQYVRRQAARILRGTALKLGITGLRKLCALAESFGLNCEIGVAGNPLLNAANLHVLLSVGNCDYFEYLYPQETERFGLTSYIEPDARGVIAAPERPGLGFELDEDWIAAHKIATLV